MPRAKRKASGADALNQRLGAFAHELRNLLNSAMLALTAIKEGEMNTRRTVPDNPASKL